MIYLIGGPPRCGKTILSRKLAALKGISCIPADILESIVKQYVPSDQHDLLFPKDKIRNETNSSNDQMYSKLSAESIRDSYIIQSKATWQAITTLVKCTIDNNEEIIIEGHQLHPELISRLAREHGKENIRSIILIKNNVDQIVETARANHDEMDWFITKTQDPSIYFKIAEMISSYSGFYQSESTKYDIAAIVYKDSFEDQIDSAITHFSDK